MANLVIDRALNGYTPGGHFRWDRYLDSTPPPQGTPVKNWTEFAHEDVAGAEQEKKTKSKAVKARAAEYEHGGNKVQDGTTSLARPVPDAETTP
jgi:hypothetical protein